MSSLDLGLIGNSRTNALIDKNGSIVWWCYPHFDSDPICCKLLNPHHKDHGFIDVQCENLISVEQHYERNTAILVTRYEDDHKNCFEVIDFAPCFPMNERMFTPCTLVRIIRRINGRPRLSIRARPTVNYGSELPEIRMGAHHITYLGSIESLRITTDASILSIIDERPFFLHQSISLIMGPDQTVEGAPSEVARSFYENTKKHWQSWTRNLAIPFEWQGVVIRAAITLRLNTFDDTGAIIAAVTTSIPEAPHTERNWDYRYCWLRDAYFVVSALNSLGATHTMNRYLDYILNIIADTRENPLQPVYGIRRETILEEHIAPSLAGYRDMGPVRVGNLAYQQIQNDIFGSIILASTHAFFDERLEYPADYKVFRDLERLGKEAVLNYNVSDAGLWELRGTKRVHTFSSIMCWASCDRLSSIAKQLELEDSHFEWAAHAQKIHKEICERAWNADMNSFVSTFEGNRLDASLLLMVELHFLKPDDPRFAGTLEAVEKHLRCGDFLLRYDEEDDFGEPETAFLVCTFWWILALTHVGQKDRARKLFENTLSKCNHLGLLSEDLDTKTDELWGNIPQTYSMVGLIQCAIRLSKPWEEAF